MAPLVAYRGHAFTVQNMRNAAATTPAGTSLLTTPAATLSTMRDSHVRGLLLEHLRRLHIDEPDTRIVDELDLCNGAARVDVAVFNGRLTGWEIKSPRDRLDRLPAQVIYYSKVCDEAWLVTDATHLEAALKVLPDWWGVLKIDVDENGPALVQHRAAEENPHVESESVVRLLWRDETIALLKENGADTSGLRRANRAVLWAALVTLLDSNTLRAAVRDTIKARPEWRRPTQRPARRKGPAGIVVATVS